MEPLINDPVLLQEFLIESEELLQGADQDLVGLEALPDDEELVNRVFRALHTIKGTAGFLGLDPVVQLGHRAEDVLSNLRRGQLKLNQPIMDALLAARDQLGIMLADIRAGRLKQYSLEPLLAELERVSSGVPAVPAPQGTEADSVAHETGDTPDVSPKPAADEETAPIQPEQKNPAPQALTAQS